MASSRGKGGQTHVVEKGETLSGIASSYAPMGGTFGSRGEAESAAKMQAGGVFSSQAAAESAAYRQAASTPSGSSSSGGAQAAESSGSSAPLPPSKPEGLAQTSNAPLPPDKPPGLAQNLGSGGISAPGGKAPGTISAEAQSKPIGEASTESFLRSQGIGSVGENPPLDRSE